MTLEETSAVLAACVSFDNRQPNTMQVRAWHAVLGDLAFEDCMAAVAQHYRTRTEFIMPAHIRAIVVKIANERVERREQERLAEEFRAIEARRGDGPPKRLEAILAQIGRTVPNE